MTFAFIFESVGGTEWLVLLGVVLIVVGPKNLPAAARKMGQMMSTLRRAADEFKRQLMTMDQEVTKVVTDATSDDTSSSAASTDGSDSVAQGDPDNGTDPYSEDNPYPGYDAYYDETQYEAAAGETAEAAAGDAPSAAEPPAKAPPTDEELRAVKITVTTDASAKGSKA